MIRQGLDLLAACEAVAAELVDQNQKLKYTTPLSIRNKALTLRKAYKAELERIKKPKNPY